MRHTTCHVPLSRLPALLTAQGAVNVGSNGIVGAVCLTEREDGSGRSFNVTLHTPNGNRTVYVRAV